MEVIEYIDTRFVFSFDLNSVWRNNYEFNLTAQFSILSQESFHIIVPYVNQCNA